MHLTLETLHFLLQVPHQEHHLRFDLGRPNKLPNGLLDRVSPPLLRMQLELLHSKALFGLKIGRRGRLDHQTLIFSFFFAIVPNTLFGRGLFAFTAGFFFLWRGHVVHCALELAWIVFLLKLFRVDKLRLGEVIVGTLPHRSILWQGHLAVLVMIILFQLMDGLNL